ncbi:MAG TPA: helix-turn-helix transcriptional regulator [Acidimicrobiia bacterium]|jgi:AraC-like DNA-binding protein
MMSSLRQTADPLELRGNASTLPDGSTLVYAVPGWDQLLHATTGVMSVETERGTWVVPPNRALWIPDGEPYRAQMHGRVAVRAIYLRAELAAMSPELRVVNVPPLLRELILHVVVRQLPLDRRVSTDAHLIDVVVDQLHELPNAPLRLPQPRDPRARALADLLALDPVAALDDLVTRAGASRRTLERLFVAETGMPIARWRRQLRLVAALRLLGAGHPVTEVAHRVGYATPSAFTAMFRGELGQTPASYFR